MHPNVRVGRHGGVATLTLARPEARNALSFDFMGELLQAIAALTADESVRVVVLNAEGPAFCAGHDLKELTARRTDADGGAAFFASTFARCSELMTEIAAAPQPFIAAIEGVATAAGCQLVATCDLAIVGAAARFATPGVNIGLFCSTPSVALTRAIAPKHAMEMLLTGDMIDAETAARIGLVNRVTATGKALGAAQSLAEHIAGKSPNALRIGKRTVRAHSPLPLDQAYALAGRAMVESLLHPDANEGIGAFVGKRAPHWPD